MKANNLFGGGIPVRHAFVAVAAVAALGTRAYPVDDGPLPDYYPAEVGQYQSYAWDGRGQPRPIVARVTDVEKTAAGLLVEGCS